MNNSQWINVEDRSFLCRPPKLTDSKTSQIGRSQGQRWSRYFDGSSSHHPLNFFLLTSYSFCSGWAVLKVLSKSKTTWPSLTWPSVKSSTSNHKSRRCSSHPHNFLQYTRWYSCIFKSTQINNSVSPLSTSPVIHASSRKLSFLPETCWWWKRAITLFTILEQGGHLFLVARDRTSNSFEVPVALTLLLANISTAARLQKTVMQGTFLKGSQLQQAPCGALRNGTQPWFSGNPHPYRGNPYRVTGAGFLGRVRVLIKPTVTVLYNSYMSIIVVTICNYIYITGYMWI